MKIAAITRLKQGDLWGALQQVGWSVAELARRSHINGGTLGAIVNMVRRPSVAQANKIQKAFAQVNIFLDVLAVWPESFAGFERALTVTQVRDVPDHLLVTGMRTRPLLEMQHTELTTTLDEVLHTLPEKQREAIEACVLDGMLTTEYSTAHHYSYSRGSKLVKDSLKKLRHPDRRRKLEDVWTDLQSAQREEDADYAMAAGLT